MCYGKKQKKFLLSQCRVMVTSFSTTALRTRQLLMSVKAEVRESLRVGCAWWSDCNTSPFCSSLPVSAKYVEDEVVEVFLDTWFIFSPTAISYGEWIFFDWFFNFTCILS